MQQIVLLTEIREQVSSRPLCTADVLTRTPIIQICADILGLKPEPGDVHCMKMEAFWILTNLAAADDENEIKAMLGMPNPAYKVQYDLPRSLLSLVDKTMRELRAENMKDLKMFYQICYFAENVVLTSHEVR